MLDWSPFTAEVRPVDDLIPEKRHYLCLNLHLIDSQSLYVFGEPLTCRSKVNEQ